MIVNPSRRGGSRKRKARKAYRKNPVPALRANPKRRVSIRRYRRNPIVPGDVMRTMVRPAATAAVGALSLDLALGYLPVPAQLKVGPFRHVFKAAGAIGIGLVARRLTKRETADQLGLGALTVVIHDAAKEMITKFAPKVRLGEYLSDADLEELGYMDMEGLGYPSAGQIVGEGMAAYMDPAPAGAMPVGCPGGMNGLSDF
jgi:hypothetical protein